MKILTGLLMAVFFVFGLAACTSSNKKRDISSEASQLRSGHYLGVAKYGDSNRDPEWAATRVYYTSSAKEPGSYDIVLLEYMDITEMAVQFAAGRFDKGHIFGYLKDIVAKLNVYRARPSGTANTYNLMPLQTFGGDIIVRNETNPRQLVLAPRNIRGDGMLMSGAKIVTNNRIYGHNNSQVNPEVIHFPLDSKATRNRALRRNYNHSMGQQYAMVKRVYSLANLKSTWRKNFLPGPYLSAYKNNSDVILELKTNNGNNLANFDDRVPVSPERAKVFTNRKSMGLDGLYSVRQPINGLFSFSVVEDENSRGTITPRIGVFIDIFDNTAGGEDVVELALVNPQDDSDFLMYYEHPENGEGQ